MYIYVYTCNIYVDPHGPLRAGRRREHSLKNLFLDAKVYIYIRERESTKG